MERIVLGVSHPLCSRDHYSPTGHSVPLHCMLAVSFTFHCKQRAKKLISIILLSNSALISEAFVLFHGNSAYDVRLQENYKKHIYLFFTEIMPRIIYHLEFLLSNPDIKIMVSATHNTEHPMALL